MLLPAPKDLDREDCTSPKGNGSKEMYSDDQDKAGNQRWGFFWARSRLRGIQKLVTRIEQAAKKSDNSRHLQKPASSLKGSPKAIERTSPYTPKSTTGSGANHRVSQAHHLQGQSGKLP